MSLLHDRDGIKQIRIFDEVRVAEGGHRDLLLVDELLVDPRALAVGQHLRRDVERIGIGVAVVGDVIGDDDRRKRPRLLQRDAFLLRLRRLFRNVARHFFLCFRHPSQVLVHQLQRLRRVEVADQHHRRVRRNVVGVEEVQHVVDRRRLEIGHAADRRMLVRMHAERLVVDDLVQSAVRLVVDAHPPLFLHDLAFVGERLLVDAQRGHAIGLEPQSHRQVLRRYRLPEDRLVIRRVRVALAADRRDHRRVRFGHHVLGPLEHQMLEQVREAGAPRLLVLGSDVIPELQMDNRRRMIFFEYDGQPVGQRRHLVLQLGRTDGGSGCSRHARERGRDEERSDLHGPIIY